MLLPKSDPTQEQTNQLTLSDNIARALLQNPRREKNSYSAYAPHDASKWKHVLSHAGNSPFRPCLKLLAVSSSQAAQSFNLHAAQR
ncbi:hypothetical protein HUW42_10850 [Bradyrhizobium diazoefficiens]|uniref:hypothetical protein n=1 Tax=Bradyrhizobium diazoefficiens TaxID=1355477 RepID=UPI0013966914|nr:hypothetical protein [Bradyrhizobium diazoefficiens]QLD41451.1 hypothetical protein HUW42_10850 [Bradyrhizobium diazoefficiens]